MAIITDYTTLQSELKDEFGRSSDSSSPWTRFIDDAESALRRDERVKRLITGTLSVANENESLPTNFVEPEALVHDGTTFFDEIDIVPLAQLPKIKALTDTTSGTPVAAAVHGSFGAFQYRFAPVPDQTYTLDHSYWETIPKLGGGTQSNWLLDEHPDIYLAASAIEAAKYFKFAELLAAHRQELERKLEELERHNRSRRFAGPMVRRFNPIG